jgi:hypothetical protein
VLELTPEQHQALELTGQVLLRIHDPHTGGVYILVREDDFERMQQVASGLARVEGWNKPNTDAYEADRNLEGISETLSKVIREQGAWLQAFADRSLSVAAPLSFQGRLTLEDVENIQRYHSLLRISKPVRWLWKGFAFFFAGICILNMVINQYFFVNGSILIVLLFFVFVVPWDLRRQVKNNYRKHQDKYLETRVILTPDRIYVENSSHRHDFIWGQLAMICDTPEGLMFCDAANNVQFWLPQRLFEGNDLRDQVLELAESNGVRVRMMS